jgi:hypothetical protein
LIVWPGQIQMSYFEQFGSSVVRVLLELWDESQGLATFRQRLRRGAIAYVLLENAFLLGMAILSMTNASQGDLPPDFLAYPLPVSSATT